MGKFYKEGCLKLAEKHNINLEVKGIDTINYLSFAKSKNQLYKTFITQEMLKVNILSSNVIYINTSHKKEHLNLYLKNLDKIFNKIKKTRNLKLHLNGPMSHDTFKRLN